jgi:hydroxyacid-oxoacid transhydrogenase
VLCCHYPEALAGCETACTIDSSRVTFGRGALTEVGERGKALGMTRVMLFTDANLRALPHFETLLRALRASGLDVVPFDAVAIEPTSDSFREAARVASEVRPDGYVSLGGGSVIDTCKAANLLVSHPAPLHTYVNAPVGQGRPVPGPLAPHIACPTTSGTGSEVTGIAIFDDTALGAKTGIASAHLRPSEAVVDPDVSASLPAAVVAASGFDVLCHALESFTARPFNRRAAPAGPALRPMSQGRNPWSDIGCREALSLCGRYFVRAVRDATDHEAREAMMWAATLAGVAFGNAGVHVPHAMAYAIAGMAHGTGYRPPGYSATHAMVPHGISVVLGAPAVFRFTAATSPDRHLEAAARLGAAPAGARDAGDAGEQLAEHLESLMRAVDMPNGLDAIGYGDSDVEGLVNGTLPQARLLSNAPCPTGANELRELFQRSRRHW